MKTYAKVAGWLMTIGALNWGLVGVTEIASSRFDLVEWLAYDVLNVPVLASITYILIGVSAIVCIASCKKKMM